MRKIGSIFISVSLLANFTFANDIQLHLQNLSKTQIESDLNLKINSLLGKNKLPETRPEFCPLNNTKAYAQTIESLKSISAVFKDDCFDGNPGLVDQLLTSTDSLQNELNKISTDSGKDPLTDTTKDADLKVNGVSISHLINGMNTIFSNNKCSGLESTPFLEKSAQIIQTFSQFALYSPSETGATVAFGGLAASSILRFINNIFNKRFEFEKEADIETFVKLNCAYYDIRNQVKSMQVFDIDTYENLEDFERSKELLLSLESQNKLYTKAKENIITLIEKDRDDQAKKIDLELEKLITPLYEMIKSPISDLPGKSAKYQQAEILGNLVLNQPLLNANLSNFIKESDGADKFLNILLKQKLSQIDTATELFELSTKDFNSNFLNDLASSFNRVIESIKSKRVKFVANFEESYSVETLGKTLNLKELRELITSEDFLKQEGKFNQKLTNVKNLKNRLEAIIEKREYSSSDSKDGGTREIIKGIDVVKNHIYGKYGKQFIEKMRDLSENQIKNFKDKFEDFKDNHLVKNTYPNRDEVNEDKALNMCVDASTLREIWVYAQKLSELGYDFLSTNNDIFGDPESSKDRKKIKLHNHSAILAKRIMTAKSHETKYKLFQDLNKESMEIENVVVPLDEAKDKLGYVEYYGKKYTIEEATKLLDKNFGQRAIRSEMIGSIMIDIMNNRDKTVMIQKLYKDYKCDSLTTFSR